MRQQLPLERLLPHAPGARTMDTGGVLSRLLMASPRGQGYISLMDEKIATGKSQKQPTRAPSARRSQKQAAQRDFLAYERNLFCFARLLGSSLLSVDFKLVLVRLPRPGGPRWKEITQLFKFQHESVAIDVTSTCGHSGLRQVNRRTSKHRTCPHPAFTLWKK